MQIAADLDDGIEEGDGKGDCILWVDGTQGMVRSISVVPSNTGHEAVVRALMQAMEHPQGAGDPARPQKIVVRDREIQFFLRGALQNLDIAIDHVPDLPLIDDIFEGILRQPEDNGPSLPDTYAAPLNEKAVQIWEDAPWHYLNEQQILAIELKRWDIDTLYVSVLGMAGVEYGLLLYRSLDSLKQFRQKVLAAEQSPKQMQQAFLEQDCLFLNYELLDDEDEDDDESGIEQFLPSHLRWLKPAPSAIEPEFGSLHPLEGLRTTLAEEEAASMLVAIEALHRFLQKYHRRLDTASIPELEGRFRIPDPTVGGKPTLLSVTVKTLPAVAAELIAETDEALSTRMGMGDMGGLMPVLRDDLVPEGALIIFRLASWVWLAYLRASSTVYRPAHQPAYDVTQSDQSEKLPIVLIQTSRPKAQALIAQLQQAQDIAAICLNPGTDPMGGEDYELGLFSMGNGEFQLFAEYMRGDAMDDRSIEMWHQWEQEFGGRCGVVIASGVTGVSKGNPREQDLLAFFETRSLPPQDLNLRPLQLQFAMDWDSI